MEQSYTSTHDDADNVMETSVECPQDILTVLKVVEACFSDDNLGGFCRALERLDVLLRSAPAEFDVSCVRANAVWLKGAAHALMQAGAWLRKAYDQRDAKRKELMLHAAQYWLDCACEAHKMSDNRQSTQLSRFHLVFYRRYMALVLDVTRACGSVRDDEDRVGVSCEQSMSVLEADELERQASDLRRNLASKYACDFSEEFFVLIEQYSILIERMEHHGMQSVPGHRTLRDALGAWALFMDAKRRLDSLDDCTALRGNRLASALLLLYGAEATARRVMRCLENIDREFIGIAALLQSIRNLLRENIEKE